MNYVHLNDECVTPELNKDNATPGQCDQNYQF